MSETMGSSATATSRDLTDTRFWRDDQGFVMARDAHNHDILGYGDTEEQAAQMVDTIRRHRAERTP